MLLSAKNITKHFAGVTALHQVDLDLQSGQVHAIIGENGAGKSTLMKILSGVHTQYEGVLSMEGETVRFRNTRDAQESGIAIIHQELNLIPQLTVSENIFLGRELSNGFGVLEKSKMRKQTRALLKQLQLDVSPDTPVQDLKVGYQQLIEIAKALLLDAKVIIMDEPTSAITGAEVEVLFQLIAELKEQGKAIVYISHKLDELFQIADHYTVLRDGKRIGHGTMHSVTENELVSMMVGRAIDYSKNTRDQAALAAAEVILEVSHLQLPQYQAVNSDYEGISFQLKKGEILGLFGLMGAGRTELLESLFGLPPKPLSGTLRVAGQVQAFSSPAEAVQAGLAFVTEDRKRDGIVPALSVQENLSLSTLSSLTYHGLLQKQKEKALTQKYIQDLQIKVASPAQRIENLSGGNQQKVILAKWLASQPKVLLLDEPSRGIDINAKTEIYKLMKALAAEGMGILMVSSELPEILAISDRILVLNGGRLSGNFPIEEATEATLLKAAIS